MAFLILSTITAVLGGIVAFVFLSRSSPHAVPKHPFTTDFDDLRQLNNAAPSRQTCTLSDGRQLGFATYGADTGPAIFFLHGFGDCRLTGAWFDEPGKNLGARIVAVDRPGVGLSSPQDQRTVLDHAEDVRQLAAHLNAKTYSVVGVSGGGPFALACAYALPEEQLKSVSLVGGCGPFDLTMRHSRWTVWLFFQIGRQFPFLLRKFRTQELKKNTSKPVEQVVADTKKQLNGVAIQYLGPHEKDRALLLDDSFLAFCCDAMQEHFKQGVESHMEEWRVLVSSDMGFELDQVRAELPVQLWYGKYDASVSWRVGEAIKAAMGGRPQLNIRDQAHLSLVLGCREEVLARALEKM